MTDTSNMYMPVAPAYGGNGNAFGGDWAWIILLLLLGWGGNGYGGNGNNGLFPWMNQANLTSNGFQNQFLNDGITSIRDGISGLSAQLCNGFAGVEQGANARQIADMQTAFASQSAMSQGFNNLQSQLAACCCENRLGTADLKYTVATENCADRQAISDGLRDLLANQTANTQRILDQLCSDKIDAKNEKIAQLQQELLVKDLAASQTAQTAQLVADNTAQTQYIVNRVAPYPTPSYTVPNPYGTTGCGCGCN